MKNVVLYVQNATVPPGTTPARVRMEQRDEQFLPHVLPVHRRFFLATRYERNDYPFISARGTNTWIANGSKFHDLEVGGGFRFGARTLLKASVWADRWTSPPNPNRPTPNGYAVVVQLSQTFDVMEMARSAMLRDVRTGLPTPR